MKKISLINIFIGEFPWFFKLFLKSCEANPTVDFYIFTDNVINYKIADNIKIIPFTLYDFNNLASQKLGFNINVEKGYKLCDFRPAFGVIFSDYIEKYDFWGITDIDVVYGRMREFLTDQILEKYDVICVRHAFITACCMLYKNTDYVNNLYKKSKDYKMIFTTQKNYAFDETNFENSPFFTDIHDIFRIKCEIESIQHVIVKEVDNGDLKAHFDFMLIEGTPGRLKWNNGLFSYKEEIEFMLYHLMYYKCNIFAKNILKWDEVPDVFYIDKFDYRSNNSLITRSKVLYDNHIRPFLWNINKHIDFFLSYNFIRKKVKNLAEGDYFYYLDKEKARVSSNSYGENFITIKNHDTIALYEMTFSKGYFFAGNLGLIFKKSFEDSCMQKQFDIIYSSGHSNTYNKIEKSY
ncbi:DUF6625 family protein [Flavobacterium hibisci]|uniref:DUF6625 family protein n=1 Tax=Flavobacterium hibisci TaxID=1914462 RepID=UPI001CC05597|nr:DUF6625 family protein [Flavobacterium hibisci]MBZ4042601.1 hypothetical protein [Flavobacterium hibisci]